MRLEQAIKDFYQFLCDPTFNYKSHKPESFRNITAILGLVFLFNVFAAQFIFSFVEMDDSVHKMTQMLEEYSLIVIFALSVILAPVIEEIIFRGFLRYPLSVVGIVLSGLIGIAGYLKYINSISWIVFGIIAAASIMLSFILYNNATLISKLEFYFKKYFGVAFYASVVLFAYLHITNFNEVAYWYLTPLLVLPQFVLGLFLGYVRVRNNLWASMYVHALNNLVPMTLLLFSPEV